MPNPVFDIGTAFIPTSEIAQPENQTVISGAADKSILWHEFSGGCSNVSEIRAIRVSAQSYTGHLISMGYHILTDVYKLLVSRLMLPVRAHFKPVGIRGPSQ